MKRSAILLSLLALALFIGCGEEASTSTQPEAPKPDLGETSAEDPGASMLEDMAGDDSSTEDKTKADEEETRVEDPTQEAATDKPAADSAENPASENPVSEDKPDEGNE